MRGVFMVLVLLVFTLLSGCGRKAAPTGEGIPADAAEPVEKHTTPVTTDVLAKEDSLLLPKTEPRLFASLKRSPCYGHCPVYEVQFYSNGQALYLGEHNVPLQGIYLGAVADSVIQQILEKARTIDFFNLSDFYPEKGKPIADLPQTITYLNDGRQEKTITNNHLAPVELIEFERLLDQLAQDIQWQPKVD
ncbi:MAG: hypothetical protein KDD19_02505 [Phaeodactylibacter sp.]|nr:hypothetical protein [Phaeodactylibacter sp.]MCB9050685.1 hypothetical protein [Lewinellaceae bacterium]